MTGDRGSRLGSHYCSRYCSHCGSRYGSHRSPAIEAQVASGLPFWPVAVAGFYPRKGVNS